MVLVGRKKYCNEMISTIAFLDNNNVNNMITNIDTSARHPSPIKINSVEKILRISYEGNDDDKFKRIVSIGDLFTKNIHSNTVTITISNGNKYDFTIHRYESCKIFSDN